MEIANESERASEREGERERREREGGYCQVFSPTGSVSEFGVAYALNSAFAPGLRRWSW